MFGVYYLRYLEPLIEKVGSLLEPHGWNLEWRAIDSLQDADPGSWVVADESALASGPQSLTLTHRVLLLLENWSLAACAHWLRRGVHTCCDGGQAERVAAELLTLCRQAQREEESSSDGDILQSVINALPVPVFYKDERHIYRGCNNAFCDFIGLPLEKIIGHSVYEVAPAELADQYYAADEALLSRGGHQRYEAQVRYADGSYRDIEFNKAVFHKPDGRVGGQVGVMLDVTERNHLTRQLDQYSRTDPLTGTGNRREFDAVVRQALQQHRQKGHPLSLLVLDVDHFKQINDRWGHSVGDQALCFLVQQCQAQLRAGDRLFRTGGEEFCILLPRTHREQACSVAERLCQHIRSQKLMLAQCSLQLRVSIGVVELGGHDTLETFFQRADQALYQAKREGRDRVVLALSESD